MEADGSRWMLVRIILSDVMLFYVWTLPATGGRSLLRCPFDRRSPDRTDATRTFGFNGKSSPLAEVHETVNAYLCAHLCVRRISALKSNNS